MANNCFDSISFKVAVFLLTCSICLSVTTVMNS